MRLPLVIALASFATLQPGCSRAPQPEPVATEALSGSASCRDCHEPFYGLWESSWHGRAMRPYSEGIGLPAGEARVGEVVCSYSTGAVTCDDESHPVAHVVGGKDVTYLLTELERGRLQVLPMAHDTASGEWFDTTASAVRHFADLSDEAVSWRDGSLTFNTACSSCHVSHLSTAYDAVTDTYTTTWSEPGIGCEVCHGPGAEHAAACAAAGEGSCGDDPKILRFGDLTPAQANDACLSCHARLIPLTDGFVPGERFFDHFDLVTLEHPDYHPDGRDLGENYTATSWRMSPCVAASDLTCLHCHTASGRFRFADRPDESCLPCHDRATAGAAGDGHAGAGPDARCVNCHMPTTTFARMRRSDHSMRPPGAWPPAELVDAARKGDWTRLDEIVTYLAEPARDEITANALVRLLAGSPDPAAHGALRRALDDPSPLVRSSAAVSLGGCLTEDDLPAMLAATGDDFRVVRVRAARALAGLPESRVPAEHLDTWRRAGAELDASLAQRPDAPGTHMARGNLAMDRRDFPAAVTSFEIAIQLDPTALEPRVNASMAHAMAGAEAAAERLLREALEIAPDDPTANLNLGLLLGGQGRTDEARAAFEAAAAADPDLAVAWFNLCVVIGAEDPASAVPHCRRAVQLRPDEPRFAEALEFFEKKGDVRN